MHLAILYLVMFLFQGSLLIPISLLTRGNKEYTDLQTVGITAKGKSGFSVMIQACSDAYIALEDYNGQAYIIQIGTQNNTESRIVKNNSTLRYNSSSSFLSCSIFGTFWIKWSENSEEIRVGRGIKTQRNDGMFLFLGQLYGLAVSRIKIKTNNGIAGSWIICDHNSKCVCPKPGENSLMTFISLSNGYKVVYTCVERRMVVVSGHFENTCDSYSGWSGIPLQCQAKLRCRKPHKYSNTETVYEGTLTGSKALSVCKQGYSADSGDVMRTCNSSGYWSGRQLYCIATATPSTVSITSTINYMQTNQTHAQIRCLPPQKVNHTQTLYEGTFIGNRAISVCDSGFNAVSGDVIRTCNGSGYWTGSQLYCKAKRNHGVFVSNTASPSTVSITSTINNMQTNQTHAQIQCLPPRKSNHTQTLYEGTLIGNRVISVCDSGFNAVSGDVIRTCNSSGYWTGSQLYCKAQSNNSILVSNKVPPNRISTNLTNTRERLKIHRNQTNDGKPTTRSMDAAGSVLTLFLILVLPVILDCCQCTTKKVKPSQKQC